jgi:hypothetical protein
MGGLHTSPIPTETWYTNGSSYAASSRTGPDFPGLDHEMIVRQKGEMIGKLGAKYFLVAFV